jgi:hypothetical protein
MKQNVGNRERVARSVAAVFMLVCSVLAPLSLAVRVAAFAVPAVYLLFTALRGTCIGYTLLGRSTCPTRPR